MSKDIKCPHCDAVYDIDSNESYHLYSTDDYEELNCNECEENFWVKVMTSYTFETSRNHEDL